MAIKPINPSEVSTVWPAARVQLERAFELTIVDSANNHYEALCSDLEQLWSINNKSWAITRVVDGREGRWLEYVAIGGNQIHQWLPKFLKVTEDWAKSVGCNKALCAGRVAWKKFLPDYKLTRVTLVKDLICQTQE